MAILPIIIAPDPRLKKTSAPVARVDAEIRRLMDDMLETIYQAPGIGLAAPQVGVLKRVIVLDVARDDAPPEPLRLANPELIWVSEEDATYEEGCLSLPEHYAEVARPARAGVRYLDHEGEIREREIEGLLATCVQHEMDHLDGILIIDKMTPMDRIANRKLLKELEAARNTS